MLLERAIVDKLLEPDGQAMLVDLDLATTFTTDEITGTIAEARAYPGILVGIARDPISHEGVRLARALLTTLSVHDPGRVGIAAEDVDEALENLVIGMRGAPTAAVVLGQVLRVAEDLDPSSALWVESMAYSTLLGGKEFRAWRDSFPRREQSSSEGGVEMHRRGTTLKVVLDRPERRNAMDASMRLALREALAVALADPSLSVELSGKGVSFCSGGDLDEFGTATDLALAHVVRISRGPTDAIQAVNDRLTAYVHGECVGAGVELPAFAHRVVASPSTTFRLPEISMGLIPGAGGTVSLPRRIGRWRAAWLILTGSRLLLERAIRWGLVDDVA